VVSEGLYVYCVIGTVEARNFGPISIGDRGDSVTTIAYRDLSAVVSSVPMNKYVVSKETMLAHEKVIEAVMRQYTALPVRFYTVAPNAEEIRNLLRTRYPEFKKLLRELDNKVELGLKALWRDMNQVLHEIAEERPQEKGSTPASEASLDNSEAEANKKVRLALDKERTNVRQPLLDSLSSLAVDLRLNKIHGDDMIMNAAFLVDRSREREFDARVEQLAATYDDRIEFKYVGPAPPYSFVNIMIKEKITPSQSDPRERR
jgi:hypothetical protein